MPLPEKQLVVRLPQSRGDPSRHSKFGGKIKIFGPKPPNLLKIQDRPRKHEATKAIKNHSKSTKTPHPNPKNGFASQSLKSAKENAELTIQYRRMNSLTDTTIAPVTGTQLRRDRERYRTDFPIGAKPVTTIFR
jgi:hypothetical protein